MTLGNRIRTLRKNKGLRQDDIATCLHISPQAVSKWENDIAYPDILLLSPLAQMLEVTVDELLLGL